jgi:hypothetical protein
MSFFNLQYHMLTINNMKSMFFPQHNMNYCYELKFYQQIFI